MTTNLDALGRRSSPARGFPVDDVETCSEAVDTDTLLYLASQRLARRLVASPAAERSVTKTGSTHPLIDAVHVAFSRHYALVLSPDHIWLTLAQGLSHHITENAESLRGRLVRHQGTEELAHDLGPVPGGLTLQHFQSAIAGLSLQIRDRTEPAMYDALICDFSTSAPEVRTASEIVLMDAYSRYFTYAMDMCVCGIPRIDLTGTVEDWQRIRERIEIFDLFGLEWWTARLRPILDEFVRAASGQPDREFWKNIYKPHEFYFKHYVTGWIAYLFPYLGDPPRRERNYFFETARPVSTDEFPSGVSSVPVQLRLHDRTGVTIQMLDLLGGFFGVQQASGDLALSPVISWCIARPLTRAG